MCHLSIILFQILFGLTVGQFVKYNFYNKTAVSPQILASFMLQPPIKMSDRNPSFGCMSLCNMNSNCSVITLDNTNNNCTMFNDQISLINTVASNSSVLFSKLALRMCMNINYFPNMSLGACVLKKAFGALCNSSLECNNLSCTAGVCICPLNT